MPESRRLRAVQSPIIPIIADLIRACPDTISLGQGVVGYGPPPGALARLESFLMDPANHKYQPVAGLPALIAALEALETGAAYVREKFRGIAENRALVQRALAALAADGLLEVPPAAGAFYYLLRVRSPRPPLALAEELIRRHGVAVIPGNAFGCERSCHLRIAYGALTPDTAAVGLGRLVRGLRALAAGAA